MPCRKHKENGSFYIISRKPFIIIVLVAQQQYFSVRILGLQAWSVPLISVVRGMLWQVSVPAHGCSKLEALLVLHVLVHKQGKSLRKKIIEYIWILVRCMNVYKMLY